MKKKNILRNDRRSTVNGFAALAMLCVAAVWALSLTGCKTEDDDDPLPDESEVFIGSWTGTGPYHDGSKLHTDATLKMEMTPTTWHFTATANSALASNPASLAVQTRASAILAEMSGAYTTTKDGCTLVAAFDLPDYGARIESYYCDGDKTIRLKYTDERDTVWWYNPNEKIPVGVEPEPGGDGPGVIRSQTPDGKKWVIVEGYIELENQGTGTLYSEHFSLNETGSMKFASPLWFFFLYDDYNQDYRFFARNIQLPPDVKTRYTTPTMFVEMPKMPHLPASISASFSHTTTSYGDTHTIEATGEYKGDKMEVHLELATDYNEIYIDDIDFALNETGFYEMSSGKRGKCRMEPIGLTEGEGFSGIAEIFKDPAKTRTIPIVYVKDFYGLGFSLDGYPIFSSNPEHIQSSSTGKLVIHAVLP
jgi:hypothetical protein